MRNLKKLLCALLAIIMIVSVFAGCTQEEKPAADGRKRRSRRSAEPKTDDSGSMKAENAASGTDRTTNERKVDDGKKEEEKPAEAPAEEKKEEAEAESVSGEFSETTKEMFEKHKRRRKARTEGAESLETATADVKGETPEDAPKRRRKKRTQPAEDPFMDVEDIPDEELPFS